MNQLITSEVRSDDEYFSESCDIQTFVCSLDSRLIKRITQLSRAVELVNAYYISEFNYEGYWVTEEESVFTRLEPPAATERARIYDMGVEIEMLHVSATEFWWTCVLKHTNLEMTSERFPISWKGE